MTNVEEQNYSFPNPQNVSARPTSMRYGLLAALALIIVGLIFNLTGMVDYSGQNSNIIPNIANWAIMLVALYLAIKFHRDEELGGYIKFGRCVNIGLWMGLIVGVVTAIWSLVYFYVIDAGLIDEIMSMIEEGMEEQGLAGDQLEMALSWTKKMFSPIGLFFVGLINSVISMTIFSLIVGAIMKKDPPTSV